VITFRTYEREGERERERERIWGREKESEIGGLGVREGKRRFGSLKVGLWKDDQVQRVFKKKKKKVIWKVRFVVAMETVKRRSLNREGFHSTMQPQLICERLDVFDR
jgi:hypothetical protein